MHLILAMSCQMGTYPSSRRMNTKKLWVRNEAYISHPVNRDCVTSAPPQGGAFVVNSHKLAPDAAGVPFAAPGGPDIEPVEVAGDSQQCLPLAPALGHERQHLGRWPVGMMVLFAQRIEKVELVAGIPFCSSPQITILSTSSSDISSRR
jgi:hypothetical protein